MQEGSSIWGRLEKRHRAVGKQTDWIWVGALLLAAVLLFTLNLGGLALRDWDEGTVAQVAREIWQAPAGSMHWLYPTLGGEPYHNKPPLIHLLIAWAYSLWGVEEWTTRLPGAILTAVSVPLLYLIGREIFHQRLPAVYSALIYLTMLPVVRHGRLAMLDGAAVCFFMVMMLCVLRSRRDLRYCLGVGVGFGLICLTKGILGILLSAITLAFLFWDTPRLLISYYMLLGMLLGTAPVILWYGAQWFHYGYAFTSTGIVNQSLSRIWQPVEGNFGPPWYYVLEVLKYGWPWLLFLPASLRLTWENRNLGWAKLALVWFAFYLITISLMETKLPWYTFPIYPSLALIIGPKLAEIENLPLLSSYPRPWVVILGVMAVAATAGGIYFSCGSIPKLELEIICGVVAITMALATILIHQGDRQFVKVLIWGSYVSLLLFVNSNYWIWELNEAYPVKPVAQMIQQAKLTANNIYTSFSYHRPSLDFYSQHQVIPASFSELQYYWQYKEQPYFLLDELTLQNLQLDSIKVVGQTQGWTLVKKEVRSQESMVKS